MYSIPIEVLIYRRSDTGTDVQFIDIDLGVRAQRDQ